MPSLDVTRYVPPTSPNAPIVHLFVLDDPLGPAPTSCSKPASAPNEWCETTFAAVPSPLYRLQPKRTCVKATECKSPNRVPLLSVTIVSECEPLRRRSSTSARVGDRNLMNPSEPKAVPAWNCAAH